jgi:hypothetical protein
MVPEYNFNGGYISEAHTKQKIVMMDGSVFEKEKLIITQEAIDKNRKEKLLKLIQSKMAEITSIPVKDGFEVEQAFEIIGKAKSLEELLNMYIHNGQR